MSELVAITVSARSGTLKNGSDALICGILPVLEFYAAV
jgi:hypothetical protein